MPYGDIFFQDIKCKELIMSSKFPDTLQNTLLRTHLSIWTFAAW